MSTLKTHVDESRVRAILNQLMPGARDLELLQGSEASQAYAFTADDRPLVLRLNRAFGFDKEVSTVALITTPAVPIPKILDHGQLDDLAWAISERAPGTMIHGMTFEQMRVLQPDLVRVMGAIHAQPNAHTTGYGHIGLDGNGPNPTWQDYLLTDASNPGAADWDAILATVDAPRRTRIERGWRVGHALAAHCPETRSFNHGDFTNDNLFAEGNHLTAVIDWNTSLYGDPLWDVAWTDLWIPPLEFAAAYFEAFPTENAWHRLLCYQVLISVRSIGFYLNTGQPESVSFIEDLLDQKLQQAANLPAAR